MAQQVKAFIINHILSRVPGIFRTAGWKDTQQQWEPGSPWVAHTLLSLVSDRFEAVCVGLFVLSGHLRA